MTRPSGRSLRPASRPPAPIALSLVRREVDPVRASMWTAAEAASSSFRSGVVLAPAAARRGGPGVLGSDSPLWAGRCRRTRRGGAAGPSAYDGGRLATGCPSRRASGRAICATSRRSSHRRTRSARATTGDAGAGVRRVRAAAQLLLPLLVQVRRRGIEHVPADGGALLVSNHSGALPPDAPRSCSNPQRAPHPRPLLHDWRALVQGLSSVGC